MRKRKFLVRNILILLLLFGFVFVSLQSPFASAYHAATAWGSEYDQSSGECAQESSVCSTIANYFGYDPNWSAMNGFGSMTTASNVYQTNTVVNSNGGIDYLATFHVGNYFPISVEGGYWEVIGYNNGWPIYEWIDTGPVNHYAYYSENGVSGAIQDSNLPPCSKGYFTFIYTCVNGGLYWNNQNGQVVAGDPNAGNQNDPSNPYISDSNQLYGYVDYAGGTGVVGMPFAWLSMYSLNTDGYANSDNSGYCYLGFQGRDPDLSQYWDLPQNPSTNPLMATFVSNFYAYLAMGYSIHSSLDWATYYMGTPSETNFGQSFLYNGYVGYDNMHNQWDALGQMRVFGDGNMVLP